MKKLISSILAAAIACSAALPLSTSAFEDPDAYPDYEAYTDLDYALRTSGDALDTYNQWKNGGSYEAYVERWNKLPIHTYHSGIRFDLSLNDQIKAKQDVIEYLYRVLCQKAGKGEYAVISRDRVPEELDLAASVTMTEEDYKALTENPEEYHLYFIDADPVLVRDNIVYNLGDISGGGTAGVVAAGREIMKMLDGVFEAVNTEKEALQQIDDIMAEWGYWGVVDDTVLITKETASVPVVFNGKSGDDKYVIDEGLGVICIRDYSDQNSGNDTISFTYDLTRSLIYFFRSGNDLYIIDKDHGNTVYIQDYFNTHKKSTIENIVLSDALTLSYEQVCEITNVITGDDNDNEITGYPEASYIFAYKGNDTISAFTGNDFIVAESGDDTITTAGGDNVIYGGSGNDTINSNTNGTKIFGDINVGNDVIFGDDGDDMITNNGVSSVVIGGKGDDTINGGFGDDVYLYFRGDGNDKIDESCNAFSNGGTDIIYFADLTPDDVYVKKERDFTVYLKDGSGKVGFNGIYQNGASKYKCTLEYIVFSDGTVWNLHDFIKQSEIPYDPAKDTKAAGSVLAEGVYKQTADKNGTHYIRYAFVVPKSKIKESSGVKFVANYNGKEKKIPATAYYKSMTSDGVQYTVADADSVLLVVTITGVPADKENALTCTLEF